jgi:DNA-binding transcriptional MerR regulator
MRPDVLGLASARVSAVHVVTCSTIDAAAAAHVSVRQLRHWAACGYVRPIREDVGRGRYLWTERDIEHAAMLGALARTSLELFAMQLAVNGERERCGVIRTDGPYEVLITVRRTLDLDDADA